MKIEKAECNYQVTECEMNEEDLKYESEFWFLYFEELKQAIAEEYVNECFCNKQF